MIDNIAQLVSMLCLWLCLALGFVAFLAVAKFTNICPKVCLPCVLGNLARLSCDFSINDEIMVLVCEGCLCCSIRITIVQGIANSFGKSFFVHFRFRHCHNLEFQFVMSLLFAGGEKPTFKTTADWCGSPQRVCLEEVL